MLSKFPRSKQTQIDLVNGWTKSKTKKNIPYAIIHLCLSFYNKNIHIILTDDKLKQFMKISKTFYSTILNHYDTKFQCFVQRSRKSVTFGINNRSIASHIKSITILIKLFCLQTNTKYIDTKTINNSNTNNNNNTLCEWADGLLPLSKCKKKNLSELEFVCSVDVLSIKYQHGTQEIPQQITMPKETDITWYLNKKDWKELKRNGVLYGAFCDNECWNIWLTAEPLPFSQRRGWLSDTHKYWLHYKLARWPQKIGQMTVKSGGLRWNIPCTGLGSDLQRECKNDYHVQARIALGNSIVYPNKVEVKICVDAMEDLQNNEITRKDWAEYGIIG